jgi:hypothetical protein
VCFTHCIRHFKLGVLGPWEFFWRAGSCIFCVCDSAVWSAGRVQFYSGILLERMAGLYRFFFLSGFVAGTVRLNWWGGGPSLLSLVCCQFSWRLDVCGRIFVLYISIFFGKFVVFCAVLSLESY